MLKIEQIKYGKGDQRLFYIAKNNPQFSVNVVVYTSAVGRRQELEFFHLEFEVWALDFYFKHLGRYIFIIFEDGLKTLISIVLVE